MCECGCTSNDDRYVFPGPGKTFYLLSLSRACVSCDAPSGFTIERIDSSNVLYLEYKSGEFNNGQLPLEKWPDSHGVAIVTGMLKHEFVKALQAHLIGSVQDEDGLMDEIGAEVLLEEMYEDAQVRPRLAKDKTPL